MVYTAKRVILITCKQAHLPPKQETCIYSYEFSVTDHIASLLKTKSSPQKMLKGAKIAQLSLAMLGSEVRSFKEVSVIRNHVGSGIFVSAKWTCTTLQALGLAPGPIIRHLITPSISQPHWPSVDQSINQSTNPWANQSTHQSVNLSITHSLNQSINQSINELLTQSIS